MKERDITLDVTRALCIMWIVGYFHLADYVKDVFFHTYLFGQTSNYNTIGVLSTFTFLSGYFLKKYEINSIQDAILFYKKRIRRFWIPFFLSALILHVVTIAMHHPWFFSHWHFVSTVLGFSIFTPPALLPFGISAC